MRELVQKKKTNMHGPKIDIPQCRWPHQVHAAAGPCLLQNPHKERAFAVLPMDNCDQASVLWGYSAASGFLRRPIVSHMIPPPLQVNLYHSSYSQIFLSEWYFVKIQQCNNLLCGCRIRWVLRKPVENEPGTASLTKTILNLIPWQWTLSQQLQRNLCVNSKFCSHLCSTNEVFPGQINTHNLLQTVRFLQKRVKQSPWSTSQVHLPFIVGHVTVWANRSRILFGWSWLDGFKP
jgi:hypothetical protein